MEIAYVVVSLVTIVVNAWAAVADFLGARFVRGNAAAVGLPDWSIVPLGVLKAAGAVGLVAGLLGWESVGIAAAIGLTLFFLGAVLAHVRRRLYHNIGYPAAFLALAVATLWLSVVGMSLP